MGFRRVGEAAGERGADEAIELPAHVLYSHWGFAAPLARLEWDVTIEVDPGERVGEYLALFSGSIDGSQCYLGLQTDVRDPQAGRGIGKGLIFSTWWSFDAADTRLAPDGFRELGTHEGRFVGVRRAYPWAVGDYRVTLSRSGGDVVAGRELDWFDLYVEPLDGRAAGGAGPVPAGPREWIGGLRFPRRRPGRPAAIDPGGLAFLEVYSAARTWSDVAPWLVGVMAFGDGEPCPSGQLEYPRFPHGQRAPNANIAYDAGRDQVVFRFGAGVVQQDRAARWRRRAGRP